MAAKQNPGVSDRCSFAACMPVVASTEVVTGSEERGRGVERHGQSECAREAVGSTSERDRETLFERGGRARKAVGVLGGGKGVLGGRGRVRGGGGGRASQREKRGGWHGGDRVESVWAEGGQIAVWKELDRLLVSYPIYPTTHLLADRLRTGPILT